MVEDAESTQNPSARAAAAAALQWYVHMGVDEAIGDVCVDGFARSAGVGGAQSVCSCPDRGRFQWRNARASQQTRCCL